MSNHEPVAYAPLDGGYLLCPDCALKHYGRCVHGFIMCPDHIAGETGYGEGGVIAPWDEVTCGSTCDSCQEAIDQCIILHEACYDPCVDNNDMAYRQTPVWRT
jgi:hypothetical protein